MNDYSWMSQVSPEGLHMMRGWEDEGLINYTLSNPKNISGDL
jgi:hypothetical protein